MKNIIISIKILKIALIAITLTGFGGIASASSEVYVGKFNNTEWYITDLRKEKKEILIFWIGEAGNSQPAAIDCATSKLTLQDGIYPIVITKEPDVIAVLYQQLCEGTKVSQKGLIKFTKVNKPKPEARLNQSNSFELQKGVEYVYHDDGSCRAGSNKVCVTSNDFLQLCGQDKTQLSNYAVRTLGFYNSDFRILSQNSVRWKLNFDLNASTPCALYVTASGILRGNSRQITILAIPNGFILNDDGNLFISTLRFMYELN